MNVGVAKETAPGERRVALVPEVLGKLTAAGLDLLVETGAGAEAQPRGARRRASEAVSCRATPSVPASLSARGFPSVLSQVVP